MHDSVSVAPVRCSMLAARPGISPPERNVPDGNPTAAHFGVIPVQRRLRLACQCIGQEIDEALRTRAADVGRMFCLGVCGQSPGKRSHDTDRKKWCRGESIAPVVSRSGRDANRPYARLTQLRPQLIRLIRFVEERRNISRSAPPVRPATAAGTSTAYAGQSHTAGKRPAALVAVFAVMRFPNTRPRPIATLDSRDNRRVRFRCTAFTISAAICLHRDLRVDEFAENTTPSCCYFFPQSNGRDQCRLSTVLPNQSPS